MALPQALIQTYGLDDCFSFFFDVSGSGGLTFKPDHEKEGIEICEILQNLPLDLPILLRFDGIIRFMIDKIHNTFQRSITASGYRNTFTYVYPLKVCHEANVAEKILRYGKDSHVGLEAGSRTEFALALASSIPLTSPIVYNGEKDEDDLEYAKLAQDRGYHPIIVMDSLAQVKTLVRLANRLNWRPHLGIRLRLDTLGAGRWSKSSGWNSKFGIDRCELECAVHITQDTGLLERLQLIHFHIGSQVTELAQIKSAAKEAMDLYAWSYASGACSLSMLDCGGGLGSITSGNQWQETDYGVEQYAEQLVQTIADACESSSIKVPHPQILLECGRALISNHALLVAEVSRVRHLPPRNLPELPGHQTAQPAMAYATFSTFRSLMDYFLEGRDFAVLPLQRLHETPTLPTVIADLTLDSDGVLERFPGGRKSTPLHHQTTERYFIAVPDIGAYQSVLGTNHNLFGEVASVEVPENFQIEDVSNLITKRGPTVRRQIEGMGFTWNPRLDTIHAERSTYPAKL